MVERKFMRYVAKFVNGFHCVFDTLNYENVQVCFLKKEVNELVKKLNQKEVK